MPFSSAGALGSAIPFDSLLRQRFESAVERNGSEALGAIFSHFRPLLLKCGNSPLSCRRLYAERLSSYNYARVRKLLVG